MFICFPFRLLLPFMQIDIFNVFPGKHVRFSVGSEGDEPMDLADESAFDHLLRKVV